MIEDYLPLVRGTARRFVGRGESYEDLVQVGAIGLIGAVDRFDPERADRLTAYVGRCVEGAIRRHLRDRVGVVRVPRARRGEPALVRVPLTPDGEGDAHAAFQALDELGV